MTEYIRVAYIKVSAYECKACEVSGVSPLGEARCWFCGSTEVRSFETFANWEVDEHEEHSDRDP